MKGREHVFWSIAVFSTVTFINTAAADYRDFKWYWYMLMAFLMILAIILNDVANKYSALEKKEKKLENSTGKVKKLRSITLSARSTSYFIVLGTATYSSIASMPSVPSFLFVLIGYLCAAAGAALPDYDSFIAIKHHRNAFTHSALIPIVSGTWAMIVCPVPFLALMIPVSGFLVGYATHLFADHFPSNSTFAEGIAARKERRNAPGNIIHIVKIRQNAWLFVNYNMVVPIIVFAMGRMSMAWFLNFVPAWSGSSIILEPGSVFLIIYATACVVMILVMMIAWREK